MCGITGFVSAGGGDKQELETRVGRMSDQLAHRGPDDSGAWVDPITGVALGFRRLAIIDLSAAGHQPMVSACERFVIVFNGEVYNFAELRRELEPRGHQFRGHSDTEVMLASIGEWGLEAAVRKFVGMFAFVLWDRQERLLHLVRDRVGIKPLYYGRASPGGAFVFGSELKALRAYPGFAPEVNRDALALLMRHSYIGEPHSIYRGILKLPAGCILTIDVGSKEDLSAAPEPRPYWIARMVAEEGVAEPFLGSDDDALDRLDTLLRDSIRMRMIADVPLGAFLSGGIDSTAVVALMQAQSNRPVKTFSIGFREGEYNEAHHARAVAAHLGTDHTELYVTPEEARAVIPKLPRLFDEPFADASQIPTYLVSAMARREVTVSLSGDGGDELFCGYTRYPITVSAWSKFRKLPLPLARIAAGMITSVEPATYDRCLGWMSGRLSRPGRHDRPGIRLYRLAELLTVDSPARLYRRLVSHTDAPQQIVVGGEDPETPLSVACRTESPLAPIERLMYLDLVTYLPDDILVKVDRASMAVSLEVRVPLLDHRVIEFVWRLPIHMKVQEGQSKRILRHLLYRYVPPELIDRPKRGFELPIQAWLRGPLRDWAEALLDRNRLRREGYLRPEPIRAQWEEHLSGRLDHHYFLWNVLMFQAWLEEWR